MHLTNTAASPSRRASLVSRRQRASLVVRVYAFPSPGVAQTGANWLPWFVGLSNGKRAVRPRQNRILDRPRFPRDRG